MHSHFSTLTTNGLNLSPVEEYGRNTPMRSFQGDPTAVPGWSADWQIEDRYGLLAEPSDIHLRYTDLTIGAEACTCEAWIVAGIYNSLDEAWIPRLMLRRKADEGPLETTFVSIIEPCQGQSNIASIRRLPLQARDGRVSGDENVAIEVVLADGRRDVLFSADTENPLNRKPEWSEGLKLEQPEPEMSFAGEISWSRSRDRRVEHQCDLPAGEPAKTNLWER